MIFCLFIVRGKVRVTESTYNWVSIRFIINQSIKRKIHRIRILECRCDERLKTKVDGSTHLAYTGWSGDNERLNAKTEGSNSYISFVFNSLSLRRVYCVKNG